MFQNQKDLFVPNVTLAKEIQKFEYTELHKWSENMVNVKNCNFLEVNYEFLSDLSNTKTVMMFHNSPLILVLFTDCFFHFLFWRYLHLSMTSFS